MLPQDRVRGRSTKPSKAVMQTGQSKMWSSWNKRQHEESMMTRRQLLQLGTTAARGTGEVPQRRHFLHYKCKDDQISWILSIKSLAVQRGRMRHLSEVPCVSKKEHECSRTNRGTLRGVALPSGVSTVIPYHYCPNSSTLINYP